jgi:hypothetical protein
VREPLLPPRTRGPSSSQRVPAGWSAYWEHWLEFGHGGRPALGDQPAISAKRRAACSTGTDAPTSSLDLLAIKGELDMALARLDTIKHERRRRANGDPGDA